MGKNKMSKWRECSEELPNFPNTVLVKLKNGEELEAFYSKAFGWVSANSPIERVNPIRWKYIEETKI